MTTTGRDLDVARRVAARLGLGDPETLRDAYRVAHHYQAPFMVKVADDMLVDLRRSVADDPGHRVAFVGRDGRSIGIAVQQLDPDFYRDHCSEVVLSRAMVECAVQDLETHQGKAFPELHGFRGAAGKVDPADTVGAVSALTDYLQDNGLPVGVPGSRVTLVDTSYKGTVQELMSAVYPETTFDGRYAFFAGSPDDPHPGSKRGYALHLEGAAANGGLPVDTLPADASRTFSHKDAIGTIEETLHGPLGSPRGMRDGQPAQRALRTEPEPLDGLNHALVSPRLADPAVREGVMHVNLLAVHDCARSVAALRDSGGDHRGLLAEGAGRYRAQVRAWIAGERADSRFAEFMSSFVRRSDKRQASSLAMTLRQAGLGTADTAAVWLAYGRCLTDSDRTVFVENFGNAHRERGDSHGRVQGERPGSGRGVGRDGRGGRDSR